MLSIHEPNERRVAAALARRVLVRILATISEARHGGSVLILPADRTVESMPFRIKYGMDSDVIQAVIKARAPVGPKAFVKGGVTGQDGPAELVHDDSTVADALLLDRDLARMADFVASLASVDGALLLGRDLRLHGFGAEILLAGSPSEEETVEFGNHPPPLGKPSDARLLDFGMRHRSAARFCLDVPGAIAFVVSQDGGTRMFCNVNGKVRQFVDLAAEEW